MRLPQRPRGVAGASGAFSLSPEERSRRQMAAQRQARRVTRVWGIWIDHELSGRNYGKADQGRTILYFQETSLLIGPTETVCQSFLLVAASHGPTQVGQRANKAPEPNRTEEI